MLDFTGFAAVELYRARKAEQDDEARRNSWLRRLRDLERHERADKRHPNLFRPQAPRSARTLQGAHSPWI